MRKNKIILSALLLFALVFLCGYETGEKADLTLSVDANLVYNNSVGNDWVKSFWVEYNGKSYYCSDGGSVTFRYTVGDEFSIHSYVKESDSYPDTASCTSYESINIGTELSKYYRSFTHTLTVVEDRGRYAGNSAQWEIKFQFEAVPLSTPKPSPTTPAPTAPLVVSANSPEPTTPISGTSDADKANPNAYTRTAFIICLCVAGTIMLLGIWRAFKPEHDGNKNRKYEKLQEENRRLEREINEIIKILPIYDKLKVLEFLEDLYKK